MSMESGDDWVSARLNFELDPQGVVQLREINQELERFRTNAEVSGRSAESFKRYIDVLNESAERATMNTRALAASMERMAAVQGHAGGYAPTSTAVPPGYTSPFSGMSAGMGRDIGPLPTTVPGPSWDQMAAADPRAYLGARAAWGGGKPSDVPTTSISDEALDRLATQTAKRDQQQQQEEVKRASQSDSGQQQAQGRRTPSGAQPSSGPPAWESWRNRAAGFMGAAGSAMGAMGPGGSATGLMGMASKGLQGWGAKAVRGQPSSPTTPRVSSGGSPPSGGGGGGEEEGGDEEGAGSSLGAIGQAAGWGGAALGIGAGLFGLYQHAGNQVQQYRALGQMRGGGFSEGMGYEMQARMMALNPFITTEQSRQIMQSALTSGYTGKEFDTVTQFMANNLKDMNMSVADSTHLLQTGVKNSNESVTELTKNLSGSMAMMKLASQTGYNTLPYREQAMSQTFDQYTSLGASPESAAALGFYAGNAFKDDVGMQGLAPQILGAAGNSMGFQQMMLAFGGTGSTPLGNIPGLDRSDPESIMEALSGKGAPAVVNAVWNTLHKIAMMSNGNMFVFRGMLRRILGLNVSRPQARKIYDQAMAVGTGAKNDPTAEHKQTITKKTETTFDLGRGLDNIGSVVGGVGDAVGGVVDSVAGGLGLGDVLPHFGPSASDIIKDKASSMFGGSIKVGDGSSWKDFDPGDKQQLEDIKSGKLQIQMPGGGTSSIPGLPGGGGSDGDSGKEGGGNGSGRAVQGHQSGMNGQLHIKVTPESMRSVLNIPQTVPLTANEQQANSGYGTATKNNPPPGDTITTRGARTI